MRKSLQSLHDYIKQNPINIPTACHCIGPQRGEPRCPCAMRGVIKRDGRWIQVEVDLGPAPADILSGLAAAPKDTP